jgi:cytochrome P450 family 135
MRAYGPLIDGIAHRAVDRWPLHAPFALAPEMQAITLEVILGAVFGIRDAERHAALRARLTEMLHMTGTTVGLVRMLLVLRTGRRPRPLERAMRAIDELLYAEIARRRGVADLDERTDIMSLLLCARDEAGERMDDGELRDQLLTLLLAGHETTATSLAWAFERLVRHPAVLGRLREGLEAGEDAYLDAVIDETLRDRPVVPLAIRELQADARVGEAVYRRGTLLAPSTWLVNHRVETYGDPYAFRPERFCEEGPDTYAWIPFGGGIRRCLGAAFARFEMQSVLRAVVTRCELSPVQAATEPVRRRNITFVPADGARVLVTARRPPPASLAEPHAIGA